jgi:hypothetical protein
MDANGWAPADDWMKATMTHRYPLALERIARGHTSITLNPAPILIGLRDGYVHCSWLLKQLSSLMRMGGTHGALDARCSNGILLSSFAPTEDTSTRRVAQRFDGFENLKDPREGTQGADWIYLENPTLASAATAPLQIAQPSVPESEPLLRVWTPLFSDLEPATPVQIAIKPVSRWLRPRVRRSDPVVSKPAQKWGLADPLEFPKLNEYERMYALPEDLSFEPKKTYRITGRAGISGHRRRIFEFTFQTDAYGLPVVR